MLVSSVEIDGADKGLESITPKVAVVRQIVLVATDEFIKAYLYRQLSQRCSLHDLASCVREETFALAGKMVEDNLADDSTKHGIAKELQSFIIDRRAALGVGCHRFVHQRLLIEAYLARIEAQHNVKSAIKLLVLAEREPYRVYQVFSLRLNKV